jgi:hypothetical protein
MKRVAEVLVEVGTERRLLFAKGSKMIVDDYVYDNNSSNIIVSAHADTICDYIKVGKSYNLLYTEAVAMYIGADIADDGFWQIG